MSCNTATGKGGFVSKTSMRKLVIGLIKAA